MSVVVCLVAGHLLRSTLVTIRPAACNTTHGILSLAIGFEALLRRSEQGYNLLITMAAAGCVVIICSIPKKDRILAPCTIYPKARRGLARMLLLIPALAMLLAGCERETKAKAPEARPVRTVTVEKGEVGQSVVLTGQIRAENEAALAFRIGGRINERFVGVGDHVVPDQVLAKLDPQNELNSLRSARAAVSAAQAQLVQARNTFKRQETLLARGSTTRASFDQAEQARRTAQSQVDDAKAQLEIAEDRVSYTQLKAGVAGTITARAAEAGEVVQPGQMIFQVARKGRWDAVFDVPAQVIRSAPPRPEDHRDPD
jgi:multidrug efflux pump subunit AcrA (membrane-fusion protein)